MQNLGDDLLNYKPSRVSIGTPYHHIINETAKDNLTIDRRSLDDVISNSYFVIPEYQRGFQWGEDEFEDLWSDLSVLLLKDFEDGQPNVNDVFFGSMFFAVTEDYDNDTAKDTYEVIDGQQRLTTTFMLLKQIYNSLDSLDISFEDAPFTESGFIDTKQGIKGVLSLYSGAGTPDNPSIRLNDYNREFLDAIMKDSDEKADFIIKQESVHNNTKNNAISYSKYAAKLGIKDEVKSKLEGHEDMENKVKFNESNKNLLEAYNFFKDKLESTLKENFDSSEEKATALINLKKYLYNNYQIGYFDVEKDSSELLMDIFRVLNDRGMDLKKMDIIKTRVYSFFENEEDREEWDKVIEEFSANHKQVEDFITDYFFIYEEGSSTRSKISNGLLQGFENNQKRDSPEIKSRLIDESTARSFLENIGKHAPYYHDIIEPFQRGFDLEDEELESRCNRVLVRLDNLGTKQWQPLVLAMYANVKINNESEKQLKEGLEIIEKITMRFVFTDLNPNILEKTYAKVGEKFRLDGFDIDIKNLFVEEISDSTGEMFGEDFVDNLVNAQPKNKQVKQLYRRMIASELLDEGEDQFLIQKLNRNDKVVHLEHIFPQKVKRQEKGEHYSWIEDFYFIDETPYTEESKDLLEVLEHLIKEDSQEKIKEISEQFIGDIANMLVLQNSDNISAGNLPFGEKKAKYEETKYFDDLEFYSYIREVDSWNYKELTERKKELIPEILECLKIKSDEFDAINIERRVEQETERRIKVLAANNSSIIE